jgi:DNA (cytosine-5)-methyltransferase 1
LVPHTIETASGLLPTPRKNDAVKRGNFDIENLRNGFPAAVKRIFLPTLGKNETKGSSRKRYLGSPHFRGAKMSEGLRTCEDDPIYLHPSFAEAVMGFPIGWGVLEPAETP